MHWAPKWRLRRWWSPLAGLLLIFLVIYLALARLSGKAPPGQDVDRRLLPFPVFHSALKCQCNARALRRPVVFVVHSATGHSARRELIRQTYGSDQNQLEYSFCLFFITGRPGTAVEEKSLLDESERSQDLVVGDFVDSYVNMTVKALFWMRFVSSNCAPSTTVVKLDDDMTINIRALSHRLPPLAFGLYGCRWVGNPARREPDSRWYVPYSVYPFVSWPPSLSGSAYIVPGEFIGRLLEQVPAHREYMHVDDVYVTGILADSAGVRVIDRARWWDFTANATELLRHGEVLFALHNHDDAFLLKLYEDVNRLTDTSRIAVYSSENES